MLALAAGFGSLLVLGFTGSQTGDAWRLEAQGHRSAAVIARGLEDALHTVERDLQLLAESIALQNPGARPEAARHLVSAWCRLRPGYTQALFSDRAGRILASTHQAIVGADLSASPWFSKALAGGVIGEAAESSRAGTAIPRNIMVAAPVGRAPSPIGVVAVQLSPEWIDDAVVAARRSLPGSERDLSIGVMNGAGRILHKSGPEMRGANVSASVGDVERGGVGWLVTMRPPEPAHSGLPLLAAISAVLLSAGVGWLIGGRLRRILAYAEALCRQEGETLPAVSSLTRDLHTLTTQIRATVERGARHERLLQEKRSALERSRDKIRAIHALSGATCWEINLATGQVLWTDGAETERGDGQERVGALNELLAHFEPVDRAVLCEAIEAVETNRNAAREVVVQARANTGRISGRKLELRIAAGGPGLSRIYALSREHIESSLAGPFCQLALPMRQSRPTNPANHDLDGILRKRQGHPARNAA